MVRYGKLEAEDPTWLFVLVKVNHLLLTVNSAGNIVIYSLKVRNGTVSKCRHEQMNNLAAFLMFSRPDMFTTSHETFSNENLLHII